MFSCLFAVHLLIYFSLSFLLCYFESALLQLCCKFVVNGNILSLLFCSTNIFEYNGVCFTGDVFKTFKEGELVECNLIDLWTSYLNDQIEHAKPVRRFSVPTYTTVSNFSLTPISNENCFF